MHFQEGSDTTELVQAIVWILRSGWNLLCNIYIPGTSISFGMLFIGIFLVNLSLRFLSLIVGVPFGAYDVFWAKREGILKKKEGS